MTYPKLDNEELLRLALDAINNDRHADAVAMLKTLLERDADHMFATYLLAAEHAQIGMMDRAEEGFRRAVALGPEFPMARFQLGQVYLTRGDAAAAVEVLAPLADLPSGEALQAYALGMIAAAQENVGEAIARIQAGLACPQEIPALAGDLARVLGNLQALAGGATRTGAPATPGSAAPLFLSNYGKPQD
jgi:tetratricopeptide (TPR) repeat protein